MDFANNMSFITVPARRNYRNGKRERKQNLTKPLEHCRTLLTKPNLQPSLISITSALGELTEAPLMSYLRNFLTIPGHRMASWAQSWASKHGPVSNQRSQRSWSHSPLIRMFKVGSKLPESSLLLQFGQGSTRSCRRNPCRSKRRQFHFKSQTIAALNCRVSSRKTLRGKKWPKTTEENSHCRHHDHSHHVFNALIYSQ